MSRTTLYDVDPVEQLRDIRRRLHLGYRKPGGVTPRSTPALVAAKTDVWYLLLLHDRAQRLAHQTKGDNDGNKKG